MCTALETDERLERPRHPKVGVRAAGPFHCQERRHDHFPVGCDPRRSGKFFAARTHTLSPPISNCVDGFVVTIHAVCFALCRRHSASTQCAQAPFRCPTSAGTQEDPEPLPYVLHGSMFALLASLRERVGEWVTHADARNMLGRYLRDPNYGSYNINLSVAIQDEEMEEPFVISRTNFRCVFAGVEPTCVQTDKLTRGADKLTRGARACGSGRIRVLRHCVSTVDDGAVCMCACRFMYWTVEQQLTHHTVTGA